MKFEYPEDGAFFATLLCNGDEQQLELNFSHLFDFRDPAQKRKDFDSCKKRAMEALIQQYGNQCMLQFEGLCEGAAKLHIDHFIPLSSNVLNKTLRKLPATKGRKVQTQSFGSNNPDNFILACPRCNAFKKHRMPDAVLLTRVNAIKHLFRSSTLQG